MSKEDQADELIHSIQVEEKCDYRTAVRVASKRRPDLFGLVVSDQEEAGPSKIHDDVPVPVINEPAAERLVAQIQKEEGCDKRTATRKASKMRPDLFGLVASDTGDSPDHSGAVRKESKQTGADGSIAKAEKPAARTARSPEMQKQISEFLERRAFSS